MTSDLFPPSIAPVVQRRYRLQPEDLVNGPVEVTIVSVSTEGLEIVRPLLHLDRFSKPLLLNPETSNDLARITGSAVMADWIGWRVKLAPADAADGLKFAILSPEAQAPPLSTITPRSREARRKRTQSLLIALLLILVFWGVYLLENSALAATLFERIFGNG